MLNFREIFKTAFQCKLVPEHKQFVIVLGDCYRQCLGTSLCTSHGATILGHSLACSVLPIVQLLFKGGICSRKYRKLEPRLPLRNEPSWVRFNELLPFWILLTLWSKLLSARLPRSNDSSVVLPLWKWPMMNSLMEVFWPALHGGRRVSYSLHI